MSEPRPSVVILAGPNGAGKSTAAPELLQDELSVNEFVNADVIARGLSAFDPEGAAIAAGRVMLARLHELAEQRASFAFETTLASRSFAPWLRDLRDSGYAVHLFFLWLSSADLAVQRVAQRVTTGGHNVPEDTVRRRYRAGIRNFFSLYQPLATSWAVYDCSGPKAKLIAEGVESRPPKVYDEGVWAFVQHQGQDED
ncbi:MAG: Zeta toxin family protein [Acidimicrobiia bacterium]|nr:Zeta toxin family protein [Acidimicrobiia bacterium]